MRLLLAILILACGGSPGPSGSASSQPELLVQPAQSGQTLLIAAPGGTLQLGAFRYDSSGYGTTLQPVAAIWTSAKPEVATVDQDGIVTAVASGTAAITARAGGQSGSATVTVGP